MILAGPFPFCDLINFWERPQRPKVKIATSDLDGRPRTGSEARARGNTLMPGTRSLTAVKRHNVAGSRPRGTRPEVRSTTISRPLRGTMICMGLVGLALILGGGGTVNPQNEMILQVLTAMAMLPLVVMGSSPRDLGAVPKPAWLLAFLVLLIPVAQLVPLPPSIWQKLPGRTIEIQSLALIQAEKSWMPLTLSPARTFASLLAIVSALLLFLQVSRLSLRGRNWLCVVIVALGFCSLMLGVLQLSHTGGLAWSLYDEFSENSLVGFQANRNAEADVLLAAMLAAGVLICVNAREGRRDMLSWLYFGIAIVSLFVGIFMTGSRTGIALFPVALLFLAIMVWPVLPNRKLVAVVTAAATTVTLASGAFLWQLPAVRKVLMRFTLTHEPRWDLWSDAWYAVRQVWPYGSGIGTIVPMLEAAERLEFVDTTRPVRAHNDWLEWMLEAGLPGIIVLGLLFCLVGFLIARALLFASRRGGNTTRYAQTVFACGFFVIEALHSIVDYPMRSMSLAALAAVAMAFVLDPAAPQRSQR